MALYSVWDWDHNAWAVYRDRRPVSVGDDPKPPKPTGLSALGADPDTQVKPLPSDAQFLGLDHICRGEVRRKTGSFSSALSGLGDLSPDDVTKYGIGIALGALAMWAWSRR